MLCSFHDMYFAVGMLDVTLWYKCSKCINVNVAWDIYPDGIINEVLRLLPYSDDQEESDAISTKSIAKYALKICGTNEYLLSSRPVTQYKVLFLFFCSKCDITYFKRYFFMVVIICLLI